MRPRAGAARKPVPERRPTAYVRAGAFFAGQGVRYVCVAGRAVRADKSAPRRTLPRAAFTSYSQARAGQEYSKEFAPEGGPADAARPRRCAATATRRRATPSCPSAARTCRRAAPRARARLAEPGGAGRSPACRGAQGATNVLLEGVYHSVSRAAAGDRPSARPWYGSAAVVDAWARFLL